MTDDDSLPIQHPYKGVTLIVGFEWSRVLDAPMVLRISCVWPDNQRSARFGDIENRGKWASREEAVEAGIRTAEAWYDGFLAKPDTAV